MELWDLIKVGWEEGLRGRVDYQGGSGCSGFGVSNLSKQAHLHDLFHCLSHCSLHSSNWNFDSSFDSEDFQDLGCKSRNKPS